MKYKSTQNLSEKIGRRSVFFYVEFIEERVKSLQKVTPSKREIKTSQCYKIQRPEVFLPLSQMSVTASCPRNAEVVCCALSDAFHFGQ